MDQEAQNTKKEIPDESDIQENPENNEKVNAESETNEKTNEKLAKKVQDAYSQNDDFQDKYVRVLADLENLKRRQIKEREEAVQRTRSQIIGDLLPTLDAFQMGMQEVETHPIQPVNGHHLSQFLYENYSRWDHQIIHAIAENQFWTQCL